MIVKPSGHPASNRSHLRCHCPGWNHKTTTHSRLPLNIVRHRPQIQLLFIVIGTKNPQSQSYPSQFDILKIHTVLQIYCHSACGTSPTHHKRQCVSFILRWVFTVLFVCPSVFLSTRANLKTYSALRTWRLHCGRSVVITDAASHIKATLSIRRLEQRPFATRRAFKEPSPSPSPARSHCACCKQHSSCIVFVQVVLFAWTYSKAFCKVD